MSLVRLLCLTLVLLVLAVSARGQEPDELEAKAAARAAMIRRIDELVVARIKSAGLAPAALAGDEEFVRRIYLDLTGAIPRVAEVRDFLADERPDKRVRLIDILLD